MTDPTIDYEVVTRTGRPILTTPDRKLAVSEAEARADEFPGLKVVRVLRRPEERVTVWTEARLRLVAGGAA